MKADVVVHFFSRANPGRRVEGMDCWKLMFWVEDALPLPFAQIPSQRTAGAKVMDLIGISDMT